MKKDLICGLDIGTFKICAVCAMVAPCGKIDILASHIVPAQGIRKGVVSDVRGLTASIKQTRLTLRKSGIRLKRVYAGINSPDLRVNSSQKKAPFSISLDRKVIFAKSVPSGTAVVSALIPTINNFVRCIKGAGLLLEDIVPSGYAQALGLFKDFNAETKNNIMIDLGAALTKLYLFKDGLLKKIIILPVGAQAITEDITIKLKVSFDCAERLKVKYGCAFYEGEPLNQKIIVQDKSIKRILYSQSLYEIIAASAERLLEKIKQALSGLDYDDKGFGKIVVTGGGSILEGFLERAEKALGKPVKMGFLHAVNNNRIQAQSALYATSIGLIHFGAKFRNNKKFFVRKKIGPFVDTLNRAGRLYREYF